MNQQCLLMQMVPMIPTLMLSKVHACTPNEIFTHLHTYLVHLPFQMMSLPSLWLTSVPPCTLFYCKNWLPLEVWYLFYCKVWLWENESSNFTRQPACTGPIESCPPVLLGTVTARNCRAMSSLKMLCPQEEKSGKSQGEQSIHILWHAIICFTQQSICHQVIIYSHHM